MKTSRLAPRDYQCSEVLGPIVNTFKFSFWVVFLSLCLFGECTPAGIDGAAAIAFKRLIAIFSDSTVRWLGFLCFIAYLIAFFLLQYRYKLRKSRTERLAILLLCAFIIERLVFLTNKTEVSSHNGLPEDGLKLLFGIVLGQGIGIWSACKKTHAEKTCLILTTIWIWLVLLVLGSLWQPDSSRSFKYHGLMRWSGLWATPNIFGLLLGVGLVLALGLELKGRNTADKIRGRWRYIVNNLYLIFIVVFGLGLVRSYSRGAWLGTLSGVIYLLWFKFQGSRVISRQSWTGWLSQNWGKLVTVVLLIGVLSFWQFRFTEWAPARRVFSILNANDFSWRNRVMAWNGAAQMMADRPWLGFSWGQAELVYENYYSARELDSGAAIQMNSYFLLGASAGIPALVCCIAYVWSNLRRAANLRRVQESGLVLDADGFAMLDWLKTVCRAAAIVSLAGFWFDGGLFKLATASMFWILLELGCAEDKTVTFIED